MAHEEEEEEIVFRADQAFDSNMWDDSELIKAWDTAMESFHLQDASKTPHKGVRPGGSKRKTEPEVKSNGKKTWKIGDACYCRWSEDGNWYAAEITDTNSKSCTVIFTEYGNYEEGVEFGTLKPLNGTTDSSPLAKQKRQKSALQQAVVSEQYAHQPQPQRKQQQQQQQQHQPTPIEWKQGDRCRCVCSKDGRAQYGEIDMISRDGTTCTVQFDSGIRQHGTPVSHLLEPGPAPANNDKSSASNTEEDTMASMLMAWYQSGFYTGYYQALQDMKNS